MKSVADALCYLHHDCSPPIVYCGIFSKNIPFSEDYEAHVSNFGTVRLSNLFHRAALHLPACLDMPLQVLSPYNCKSLFKTLIYLIYGPYICKSLLNEGKTSE